MKTAEEQFLDDVIITAVEGGINYWATVDKYTWSDDGPTSVVVIDEDSIPDGVLVDREVVRRALNIVRDPKIDVDWNLADRERVIGAAALFEAGDIDAGDADCILQIALFGKVIYG